MAAEGTSREISIRNKRGLHARVRGLPVVVGHERRLAVRGRGFARVQVRPLVGVPLGDGAHAFRVGVRDGFEGEAGHLC